MKKSPDFRKLLHARGLKATPSRLRVLEALREASEPISIQDVTAKLPGKSFKVTVYRVLADLKEARLVRQVDFQQPRAYFELADPKDHHHLVCVKCQKIEGFTGCEADSVAKKALRKSKDFASVTGHSFELFGVCRSCKA